MQWLLLLWSIRGHVGFNAQRVAPMVAAHGFSYSTASGIFPDQGLNLSPTLAGGFLTAEPPGISA